MLVSFILVCWFWVTRYSPPPSDAAAEPARSFSQQSRSAHPRYSSSSARASTSEECSPASLHSPRRRRRCRISGGGQGQRSRQQRSPSCVRPASVWSGGVRRRIRILVCRRTSFRRTACALLTSRVKYTNDSQTVLKSISSCIRGLPAVCVLHWDISS